MLVGERGPWLFCAVRKISWFEQKLIGSLANMTQTWFTSCKALAVTGLNWLALEQIWMPITWGQVHKRYLSHPSLKLAGTLHSSNFFQISQGLMSKFKNYFEFEFIIQWHIMLHRLRQWLFIIPKQNEAHQVTGLREILMWFENAIFNLVLLVISSEFLLIMPSYEYHGPSYEYHGTLPMISQHWIR